jgi:hypothetical protein
LGYLEENNNEEKCEKSAGRIRIFGALGANFSIGAGQDNYE